MPACCDLSLTASHGVHNGSSLRQAKDVHGSLLREGPLLALQAPPSTYCAAARQRRPSTKEAREDTFLPPCLLRQQGLNKACFPVPCDHVRRCPASTWPHDSSASLPSSCIHMATGHQCINPQLPRHVTRFPSPRAEQGLEACAASAPAGAALQHPHGDVVDIACAASSPAIHLNFRGPPYGPFDAPKSVEYRKRKRPFRSSFGGPISTGGSLI